MVIGARRNFNALARYRLLTVTTVPHPLFVPGVLLDSMADTTLEPEARRARQGAVEETRTSTKQATAEISCREQTRDGVKGRRHREIG